MRVFFLWMSHSKFLHGIIMRLFFTRRAARRFVAGETIDDAIAVIRALNAGGILATVDHLGENVETKADARRATEDYRAILDRIGKEGVKSHASIKLTQLGLDIGADFCRENVACILRKAKEIGTFIRIDMESSDYTGRTLDVHRRLRREYENVGVAIQSYLYRSKDDVAALCQEGANVRLCKGAYQEPPDKAFPHKADVDASYVALARMLLSDEARAQGAYIAIATHDPKMIEAAKSYIAEHRVPRDRFEFQMLYGIRRDLLQQLVQQGFTARVYVPYGSEWYPYLMRRLGERPANVWFVLRSLFRK
ncbi:MAG TPA: proline dehydrogenase family protein [Anaerolineae bacterium]|nr:proline dehydrogenase family protein [Anaerolineae bacterium]